MASQKTHHRPLFADHNSPVGRQSLPPLKINKKLDFDSCSEEDIPRSSSPDPADLHKKLIFDDSEGDFELSDVNSSPMKFDNLGLAELIQATIEPPKNNDTSLMELHDLNMSGLEPNSDKFSPCRTRSGKIYTSVEKRRDDKDSKLDKTVDMSSTNSASKLPTPVFLERPRTSRCQCYKSLFLRR
jgi:hypothetical protein